MRLLTVNAGSASFKVGWVEDGRGAPATPFDDVLGGPPPDAVVHRVVHGGNRTVAVLVDDAVVAELAALVDLAPLHQPPALAAMDRCRRAWPGVPNVACFDTAFHATVPVAARTYALPARFRRQVRSYGFHGLSHAWAVGRVAQLAPRASRVVVAHLGGGQSLCAALEGRSIATTMGFTPLDGLVMATRCGSIDPGAVLFLHERSGEDVATVLERESGLLGLCGAADVREVHRLADAGDGDAGFALEVWRHRAVALVGSCVATLGGLDALVFTGGIGEHDGRIRAMLADAFGWLGVAVAEEDDADDEGSGVRGATGGDREITAPGATVRTFVVEAREDLQMWAEAGPVLAGT